MSISTYAELQVAVANRMHRADLTDRIPEFIKDGEARLNRKLRTLDMETIGTVTADTASRFASLPAGCVEIVSLYVPPSDEVAYVDPAVFRDFISDGTGQPSHYTVGAQIEFNIQPDSAYALECRYLKKYDLATDLTNWLLANHSDLYLLSALVEAAFYAGDDNRMAVAEQRLNAAVDELNYAEHRRRGTGYMRMDDGLGGARTSRNA